MDSGGLVRLARLGSFGSEKRVLVSGLEPGLGDVLVCTVNVQRHFCNHPRNHLYSIVSPLKFVEKLRYLDYNGSFIRKLMIRLTTIWDQMPGRHLTNQVVAASEEKEYSAQKLLPPRHLLTEIVPRILLKMRDLTTFTNKLS